MSIGISFITPQNHPFLKAYFHDINLPKFWDPHEKTLHISSVLFPPGMIWVGWMISLIRYSA
jgi:hypothetical protein